MENKCGECGIRDCAIIHKVEFCSQCEEFPCEKISVFNNYKKPHHAESQKNLILLLELGEVKWLEYMKNKSICKHGERLSWYYRECEKCANEKK